MKPLPSQDELKESLRYDHETGVFTRKKPRLTPRGGLITPAGSIAGKIDSRGHRQISVNGKIYAAHRLAFLYMTGQWPKQPVDHINGNGDDNRWANLREVTHSENSQNQRRAKSSNLCGFLGVSKKGPASFTAKINIKGAARIHIGTFKTAEAAHAAYVEAKRRLHAGCTI